MSLNVTFKSMSVSVDDDGKLIGNTCGRMTIGVLSTGVLFAGPPFIRVLLTGVIAITDGSF